MSKDRFEGQGTSFNPGEPYRDTIGEYGHNIDPAAIAQHQSNMAALHEAVLKVQADDANVELQKNVVIQATQVIGHIFDTTVGMITPYLEGGKAGAPPIPAVAGLKIPGLPDIGGMLSGVSGLMGKFNQVKGLLDMLPKIG